MSLLVSQALLEAALNRPVTSEEFIEVVKTSLPKFWARCQRIAVLGASYSCLTVRDEALGQTLRGMASSAIRREVEGHFGGRFVLLDAWPQTLVFFKADAQGEVFDFDQRYHQALHQHTGHVCGEDTMAKLRHSHVHGLAVIEQAVEEVHLGGGIGSADPPFLEDAHRIELLELLAVQPWRNTLEAEYGVDLAFLNCHSVKGRSKDRSKAADKKKDRKDIDQAWADAQTTNAQILNQDKVLQHC